MNESSQKKTMKNKNEFILQERDETMGGFTAAWAIVRRNFNYFYLHSNI
jgi:hypothetical protein